MLVHGQRGDAEALREEVAGVLEPLGLRLSPAKTQIVHLSEALDFLGFRLQWRRKQGTGKWYLYTFIAARSVRAVKAKIRALTPRRRGTRRTAREWTEMRRYIGLDVLAKSRASATATNTAGEVTLTAITA